MGGGTKGLLFLSGLEQQDCNLAKVKVDKVLRLVRDVRAKVSPNDAVPCRVVLFVEFLFDVGSNVLFNVKLLECCSGAVYGVLLHVLGHVGILDHSFTFSHLQVEGSGGAEMSTLRIKLKCITLLAQEYLVLKPSFSPRKRATLLDAAVARLAHLFVHFVGSVRGSFASR